MVFPNLPPTRRIVKFLIISLLLIILINIIVRIYNFANLFAFLRPHSGILITQKEILDAFVTRKAETDVALDTTPVIPKILHQVFHNWSDPENTALDLPSDWEAARKSCIALNPDWEYKLWTSKASRDFIEDEFPWFLESYDSYRYPIQRVDVIRYFALRHFGGIYIDLENGCNLNLDPITYLPAFTTFGGHGTLSNNIIGGEPNHPLFFLFSESLMSWNWNWILPIACSRPTALFRALVATVGRHFNTFPWICGREPLTPIYFGINNTVEPGITGIAPGLAGLGTT